MGDMFSGLRISGSGMSTAKTWIDALSDNVANVNTIRSTSEAAYQERFVVVEANEYGDGPGSGVHVDSVRFGDPNGRIEYQPDHPLADAAGMVRVPDMDLSDQMTHLMAAQRTYQLNATVFERARDSYQRALEIGK
jgi:flagellar basal-body rod protein FlgC